MRKIRTDLAMEAREFYCENNEKQEPNGVETQTEEKNGVLITRVEILNEEGEQALGKPAGRYVTMECSELASGKPESAETISKVLAEELKALLPENCNVVFVAGLGNWNITPDALGPKTVSKLFVTRHLKQYFPQNKQITEVCTASPGVLGITGIETGEIIKGVSNSVQPDCLIAIDALASRRMSRVNSTIQLSNTGINPGSGVGNHRFEITEKTMGVPVIGVGVPTVVDAATIAGDSIELLMEAFRNQADGNENLVQLTKLLDDPYDALREVLHQENLIVTPKDTDFTITETSKVLASGLNLALQPGFDYQELLQLQN